MDFYSFILRRMLETEQLANLDSCENAPELICVCVAKIFRVEETEVALLELGGSLLNFLYPARIERSGGDSSIQFGCGRPHSPHQTGGDF